MALPTKPTIAFAAIKEFRLVVLSHGRANPTDREWATFLRHSRDAIVGDTEIRVLVLTRGGHPTREQQALMSSSIPVSCTRVAIVSPSVISRFVTSILVMTNPGIRCFSPEQRPQAYEHLGIARAQLPQIERLAKQLSEQLDTESPG